MSPFALYVMSPTTLSSANVFFVSVLVDFVQSGSIPPTVIVTLSAVIFACLKYLSVTSNTTVTVLFS